jgi:hypothetical protein
MKLIHYGAEKYDPGIFRRIKNSERYFLNKPIGGLWTSPLNAEYGWGHFCTQCKWNLESLKKSFIIELKDNAKILTNYDIKDFIISDRVDFERIFDR